MKSKFGFAGVLLATITGAQAELVAFVTAPGGGVYFVEQTGGNCPLDQSAVFVQPNPAASKGAVYKTAGCWTKRANGDIIATWPVLGETTHKASSLRAGSTLPTSPK